MTDNQERAKEALQRYGKLQSQLRVLEFAYDRALDGAEPGAAWPDIGVVPGERWPAGKESKMRDLKTGRIVKDSRKYHPIKPGTNRVPGRAILATVDDRLSIEQQMIEVQKQMCEIEAQVWTRCGHEQAEVLIRSFVFGQSWSEIAAEIGVSVRTIGYRYSHGLEAFGAKIA